LKYQEYDHEEWRVDLQYWFYYFDRWIYRDELCMRSWRARARWRAIHGSEDLKELKSTFSEFPDVDDLNLIACRLFLEEKLVKYCKERFGSHKYVDYKDLFHWYMEKLDPLILDLMK
jgi:hypothetical protein